MEIDSAAGVRGDTQWPEMETISQNIDVVPQATLKKIAKGPLVGFTHECDDFEYVPVHFNHEA